MLKHFVRLWGNVCESTSMLMCFSLYLFYQTTTLKIYIPKVRKKCERSEPCTLQTTEMPVVKVLFHSPGAWWRQLKVCGGFRAWVQGGRGEWTRLGLHFWFQSLGFTHKLAHTSTTQRKDDGLQNQRKMECFRIVFFPRSVRFLE